MRIAFIAVLSAHLVSTVFSASVPSQLRSHKSTLLLPIFFPGADVTNYYATLKIGTPPRSVDVQVDTGSGFLYVPNSRAPPCMQGGCAGGSYRPSQSSSSQIFRIANFTETFVGNDVVQGNFVSDIMTLPDAKMHNITFATVDDFGPGSNGSTQIGVLGLGFGSTDSKEGVAVVPTFLDDLYKKRLINSHSFSVYLGNRSNGESNVLFGGIDTAKFSGDLVTLPVSPYPDRSLFLDLVSVTAHINGTSKTFHTPRNNTRQVGFDTGGIGASVPQAAIDYFVSHLRIKPDADNNVPCDSFDPNTTFTIRLSGADGTAVSIDMSVKDFLPPATDGQYRSSIPLESNEEAMCQMMLQPTTASPGTLGPPFQRSAYIHFNLGQRTMSFAQAVYTNQSNIVSVGPGPVPNLTSSFRVENNETIVPKKDLGFWVDRGLKSLQSMSFSTIITE